MSKQQWGHGYWKGREDEQKRPSGPKYIGVFDSPNDPYINRIGQIHEKHGDILTVEWIDYFDMLFAISRGYEPSWDEVVGKNVEEIDSKRMSDRHKFYYSWLTVAGEFIKAEKRGQDNDYQGQVGA